LKKSRLNRQENVPRQIYEILRTRILSTELPPGTSINERDLVEALGVSRTPIREAIRRLSNDGLISIVPNVGTSVATFDPLRVHEFCQIRTGFECIAIEAAVKNFSLAEDRKLAQLIDDQDKTIDSGDMISNIAIDTEFHRVIMEMSGYKVIPDFLHRAMGEILRARHLSIQLPGRLREPIIEHQKILKALRSGNPKACTTAMKDHLDKSFVSIMTVLESMNVH
jgi:GntR family transcriptional regulator, rspAB operon transcriptional repressor